MLLVLAICMETHESLMIANDQFRVCTDKIPISKVGKEIP
jgi:hypothetical protein